MQQLRTALAHRIGPQRLELWFGDETRLDRDGDILRVAVANDFVQQILKREFLSDILAAARDVLGPMCQVEVVVDSSVGQSRGGKEGPADGASFTTAESREESNADAVGGAVAKPRRRAPSSSKLRKPPAVVEPRNLPPAGPQPVRRGAAATGEEPGSAHDQNASSGQKNACFQLKHFIVGAENDLAVVAVRNIIRQPNRYSPLLLHGPTGVGKTHLMWSIRAGMCQRNPRCHVVVATAEQFTTQFLEALNGRGLPSFRQKYRSVDALLLDDVQFFEGKRATLDELLYTVDTLLQLGRQVVLTSDREPGKLRALGDELTSRLSAGLACEMRLPDFESRRRIAGELARRMELQIDDDVARLLAAQIRGSARMLRGALNRLQAGSSAAGKSIDARMAESTLEEFSRQNSQPVQLGDIERAVCDIFGLRAAMLKSATKTRQVNAPRMLAMWLARKYTRAALSEIGDYFGRRSHSTVISAKKRVDSLITKDARVAVAGDECSLEEAIRRVEDVLRRA